MCFGWGCILSKYHSFIILWRSVCKCQHCQGLGVQIPTWFMVIRIWHWHCCGKESESLCLNSCYYKELGLKGEKARKGRYSTTSMQNPKTVKLDLARTKAVCCCSETHSTPSWCLQPISSQPVSPQSHGFKSHFTLRCHIPLFGLSSVFTILGKVLINYSSRSNSQNAVQQQQKKKKSASRFMFFSSARCPQVRKINMSEAAGRNPGLFKTHVNRLKLWTERTEERLMHSHLKVMTATPRESQSVSSQTGHMHTNKWKWAGKWMAAERGRPYINACRVTQALTISWTLHYESHMAQALAWQLISALCLFVKAFPPLRSEHSLYPAQSRSE